MHDESSCQNAAGDMQKIQGRITFTRFLRRGVQGEGVTGEP